jgi:hypothetical protein
MSMNQPRKTVRLTLTEGLNSEQRQTNRRRTISSIVREAENLGSVYEAEYFISSLLGQLWGRRGIAPPLEGFDQDLILGAALAQDLAEHGGRGGRLVLHAIGRLARGGLGALGAELARQVDEELPVWGNDIGRSKATSAVCASVAGDGVAILLEVAGAGMVDHSVAIFIDDRRGGIAKHLGLVRGKGQRPRDAESELGGEPIDVRNAGRRVLTAISVTDNQPDAPVGETFAQLRTIAIARAASALPTQPPLAWAN